MRIAYSLPAMEVKRYMMYIKQCSQCHQPVIDIFTKLPPRHSPIMIIIKPMIMNITQFSLLLKKALCL